MVRRKTTDNQHQAACNFCRQSGATGISRIGSRSMMIYFLWAMFGASVACVLFVIDIHSRFLSGDNYEPSLGSYEDLSGLLSRIKKDSPIDKNLVISDSRHTIDNSGSSMTGIDAIEHAIRASKIRVYIYNLPARYNQDHYLYKPGANVDRMMAAERRLHEFFKSDGIATENPELADFFYVPIYPVSACTHAKYNCTSWRERPECAGCKIGYELLHNSYRYIGQKWKYLRRNEGRDHIFPVLYDYGVCMETFADKAEKVHIPEAIQKSILLTYLGDASTKCYRSGQDVVLPPFVDEVSSAVKTTQNNQAIFMYFRGNTGLHPSSPTTRKDLVRLYGQEPGSIVTDKKVDIGQMHAEIMLSTFCLLPAGFAPWTYRFVEVLMHECIPVFFDNSDLPFQTIIDYNQMAIFHHDDLSTLLSKLRMVSKEEIQAKKAYIRKVKPFFSYRSDEFRHALMQELYKRKQKLEDYTDYATIDINDDNTRISDISFNFDVDFVYTWVNGSDPMWIESKKATERNYKDFVKEDALADKRFHDREEMRYSLRSLIKNAPWLRKIHIVVAGNQNPAWLNTSHPMINLVRHEDIFPKPERALPTFNSMAIESVVDLIPDLSEQFILMNDDFFIGKPITKSKFFTFEGYPKVGFQDSWLRERRHCRMDIEGKESGKHSYLQSNLNGFKLADGTFGHAERRVIMHQAYPLTKSLYQKARKLFPNQFKMTSRSQFRTPDDHLPYLLAYSTGFYDGTVVKLGKSEYPTNSYASFTDNSRKNKREMEKIGNGQYELFFLNDNTSNDDEELSIVLDDEFKQWMESLFPDRSPFEYKHQ